MLLLLSILAALASCVPGQTVHNAFVGGQEGYFCYRIPALVRLANGTLLAFAEGRKFSCVDHDWNDIVMKSSYDGGSSWTPLRVIMSNSTDKDHVTIGNPAPVYISSSHTIFLPYCRNNLQIYFITSLDGGSTWTTPVNITTQVSNPSYSFFATGPPGSLTLPSGRILVPTDHIDAEGKLFSHVIYSDDHGKTWNRTRSIPDGNECQLALAPNGSLVLNMRTAYSHRQVAFSTDEGQSFWPAMPIINETACEASMVAVNGKTLVMSSSFASTRSNMTLHLSSDGLQWTAFKQLYPGSSAYSSLVVLNSTAVGILYEVDNYGRLVYETVSVPQTESGVGKKYSAGEIMHIQP